MNIFHLDKTPKIAAQFHNNRHCVKMITESAQILSNCYSVDMLKHAPRTKKGETRSHSYPFHPCSKWVQQSLDNWMYVVELGMELQSEATYRGYEKAHSSLFIEWCLDNVPELPDIGPTPEVLAMPDNRKIGDTITSYREYYSKDKVYMKNGKRMDFWGKRDVPFWFYC